MHLMQQLILFVTLSAMEIKFKCTVYLCIPDDYKILFERNRVDSKSPYILIDWRRQISA